MSDRREPNLEDKGELKFTRRDIVTAKVGAAAALLASSTVGGAKSSLNNAPADSVDRGETCRKSSLVSLAVVQQDGNPGHVDDNRNKALSCAMRAVENDADVVLFHEVLLAGYVRDQSSIAESDTGETTRAFSTMLKGSDSLVIYGLTEKDKGKLYNSAVVVSENGVVAKYRKTHLFPVREGGLRDEPSVYTAGDRLVTFKVKGQLSGLMICFDGQFPEMTRAYANIGCRMMFWMNNRYSCGHEEVRDLAFRNSMIIAASCCTGKNETGAFCAGGSNITDARGNLVEEVWGKEGIIMATVNPGEVASIRSENVWFTCQRPELYTGHR